MVKSCSSWIFTPMLNILPKNNIKIAIRLKFMATVSLGSIVVVSQ